MVAEENRETGPELVGLDDRPRPADARARIFRGLKQSAPFSSLQRRIILFNLLGLAILVGGVLYLNQFRATLIEQRTAALEDQGQVIALALARTAAGPQDAGGGIEGARARALLADVTARSGVRLRLFDRGLAPVAGSPEGRDAGPAAADSAAGGEGVADRVGDAVHDLGAFLGPDSAREASAGPQAAARPAGDPLVALDLAGALAGGVERAVGLNERSEPIVSVAVPVRAGGGGAPIGVLALSTRGGEIGRIVREERALILQVFFVAALVSVGLSVLLANTIAAPIRRLAAAAESERSHAGRPVNPERTEIPDMTGRTDEIGELSAALIRMTEALYKRVEAIESFASDVAHEIKNPLTSLRSAVDTMIHAKTPEQRQRLLDVIKADVGRMDRLVTDISNASRLDAELVRERMAPFDLAAQIGMLAGVTETQGEARGVTVETRLPGGELVVQGLESRIAQVVANLLDNALSFSPDGGRIRVEAAEGAEVVRVSVSDEGPGIPPDSLASIFERFYTERPGAESFGSHSGLGLSISRQIVEAHGGRIWAENLHRPGDGPDAPPRGARFSFDLPR